MQMTVWKKGEGEYKVASETTQGAYYRVRNVGDIWVCTCPRFANDSRIEECKHIGRVKKAIEIENDPVAIAYDTFPEGRIIDDTPLGNLIRDIGEIQSKLGYITNRLEKMREDKDAGTSRLSSLASGGVV